MDMMHRFQFGDVRSTDYPLYVLDKPNRGYRIERDYESVSIPGRNGDLHIDHGRYGNMEITYQCAVMHDADAVLTKLNMVLLSQKGYQRLEDTFDPEFYRLAVCNQGINVTPSKGRRAARFDLTFDCKPQKFLKSGEVAISYTQNGTIYNAELFPAKPLIRIYGNGTVTIGNTAITWTGASPYVDIDCDVQDCYYMGSNMNAFVELSTNEFPELDPGSTNITKGAVVARIEITPRWWRI